MQASVLLVEDDPTLMKVVSEALSDEGLDIVKAIDGETAVEHFVLHPERFALLFTNVQLPGDMQGGDVAKFVRTRRPNIPVIIASGEPRVMEASWKAEWGYFLLEKPYRLHELSTLARQLAGAGSRQVTTRPTGAKSIDE